MKAPAISRLALAVFSGLALPACLDPQLAAFLGQSASCMKSSTLVTFCARITRSGQPAPVSQEDAVFKATISNAGALGSALSTTLQWSSPIVSGGETCAPRTIAEDSLALKKITVEDLTAEVAGRSAKGRITKTSLGDPDYHSDPTPGCSRSEYSYTPMLIVAEFDLDRPYSGPKQAIDGPAMQREREAENLRRSQQRKLKATEELVKANLRGEKPELAGSGASGKSLPPAQATSVR